MNKNCLCFRSGKRFRSNIVWQSSHIFVMSQFYEVMVQCFDLESGSIVNTLDILFNKPKNEIFHISSGRHCWTLLLDISLAFRRVLQMIAV